MAIKILTGTDEELVTINQLLDAIQKNGYEQSFGRLYGDGDPVWNEETKQWEEFNGSACAMGQALLNLGYNSLTGHGKVVSVWHAIMYKNDIERKPLDIIVAEIRQEFTDDLDEKFVGKRYVTGHANEIRRP